MGRTRLAADQLRTNVQTYKVNQIHHDGLHVSSVLAAEVLDALAAAVCEVGLVTLHTTHGTHSTAGNQL